MVKVLNEEKHLGGKDSYTNTKLAHLTPEEKA